MLPKSNAIILSDEEYFHLNCRLIQAAEEENYDRVESLITQGADVNVGGHLNKTLLHIAAEKGNSKFFQVLMKYKACVYARDGHEDTPLHYAAKAGNYDLVSNLLKYKANINLENRDLNTPLHYAAQGGYSNVVNLLVRGNADVNAQNHLEDTPLHDAAQKGNSWVVNILLNNPNIKVNARGLDGKAPLHYAAQGGYGKVVKSLIDHKAVVDARDDSNDTPLCYASRSDKIEVVEILISHNADVNAEDFRSKSILHNAAEKCNPRVAKILIDHNADVNTRCFVTDFTVLHHLVENLTEERLLLSNMRSQREKSIRDFSDFLKILSETDINPNIPNRNQETSLQVLYKKYDIIKHFVSSYDYDYPMLKVFQNLKEDIIALTVKAYNIREGMALHIMCREDIEQYIIIPELKDAPSAANINISAETIWRPDPAQLLENSPVPDLLDNFKAAELLEVAGAVSE